MTELEIIAGLRTEKRDAFKSLFDEFHTALFYFAEKITGDKEESKDIVISTFTKLWMRREHFEAINNIKAFLYITTRNACLDYIKYRQRKTKFQESLVHSLDLFDEQDLERFRIETELLRKVHKEIQNLPDRYRKVFQLTYLEGRKTNEVAKILNLSVTNVTTLRSRGMQLLKIALADEELIILYIVLTSSCFKN